ncbi:uncharacterized protein LOC107041935 [Diachasma alloeum]|uniref:uncharacterized protein LOC107041935 n=1 Tax=Diachasma alloeum TaxID=454923 RepID=UPI00073823F2|nr:uncharacterized protein LOC107041935 [Diachasma alloeum]
MGKNPLKWKLRTLGYLFLGIFVFYMIFLFKKNHHFVSEFTIKNTRAKSVWEFVADFSNMLKLNPTIEEFDIINESGNYDHWKYSVKYKEHLHHIPAVKNIAHGHFSIRQDGHSYKITSNHQTCFFEGFNCVNSISEFTFLQSEDDTKCVETIQYECPLAFSQFCYREVAYQRNEIMTRLTRHFSLVNIHTEENK